MQRPLGGTCFAFFGAVRAILQVILACRLLPRYLDSFEHDGTLGEPAEKGSFEQLGVELVGLGASDWPLGGSIARQEQPLAAVDRSYRGTYPSAAGDWLEPGDG
jgi:hypothetical protein